MSDTSFRHPEIKRSYSRFDLDKSDEELEEDVLDWLEEMFGPFSDAPQRSTSAGKAGRDEIDNEERL